MSLYGIGDATGAFQAAGAVPTLVRKTVTFTGAAGAGAVGTVAVFTVTGDVEVKALYIKVTTTLADTVDGAVFQVGTATLPTLFVDTSDAAVDLDALVTGKWLDQSAPVDLGVPALYDFNGYPIALSESIAITVATQAITSGVLAFYLEYIPLSAGASVVAA